MVTLLPILQCFPITDLRIVQSSGIRTSGAIVLFLIDPASVITKLLHGVLSDVGMNGSFKLT
jgi:hypothetical protein